MSIIVLEERNSQAFSGEGKGDLRRDVTTEIGAIDTFVMRKVSNLGVSGGGEISLWCRNEGGLKFLCGRHSSALRIEPLGRNLDGVGNLSIADVQKKGEYLPALWSGVCKVGEHELLSPQHGGVGVGSLYT